MTKEMLPIVENWLAFSQESTDRRIGNMYGDFVAEIDRLQTEHEAMRLRLERYCKAYGPEPGGSQVSRPAAAALATESTEQAAPGPILQQQMESDTSPLTHQEIFSAVYAHASEIVRLTQCVPAACK